MCIYLFTRDRYSICQFIPPKSHNCGSRIKHDQDARTPFLSQVAETQLLQLHLILPKRISKKLACKWNSQGLELALQYGTQVYQFNVTQCLQQSIYFLEVKIKRCIYFKILHKHIPLKSIKIRCHFPLNLIFPSPKAKFSQFFSIQFFFSLCQMQSTTELSQVDLKLSINLIC